MLRSGTAVGALIREAAHAPSLADFLNKMNVALKDSSYLIDEPANSLLIDCNELVALLVSIVKTTKDSLPKRF